MKMIKLCPEAVVTADNIDEFEVCTFLVYCDDLIAQREKQLAHLTQLVTQYGGGIPSGVIFWNLMN